MRSMCKSTRVEENRGKSTMDGHADGDAIDKRNARRIFETDARVCGKSARNDAGVVWKCGTCIFGNGRRHKIGERAKVMRSNGKLHGTIRLLRRGDANTV